MKEETNAQVVQIIENKFMQEKWNCSETVVFSILNHFNVDDYQTAVSCASGLGGGMGGTRNVCGAVAGAGVAIGFLIGRYGYKAQNKQLASVLTGSFIKSFKEKYFTINCEKLVSGFDFESAPRRMHCMELVIFAAIEAVALIEKAETK